MEEDGFVWYLTGFYGWPNAQQKENSWRLLKYLQTFVVGPWVVIGDFNDTYTFQRRRVQDSHNFHRLKHLGRP